MDNPRINKKYNKAKEKTLLWSHTRVMGTLRVLPPAAELSCGGEQAKVGGLEHLLCEGRLKHLRTFRLENRWLKGDLRDICNIMHGVQKVDWENLFSPITELKKRSTVSSE